uniref:Putative secreted protein n=1 Tax=Anopheles darlingi TaxID=43151 RepID=A0A2M4D3F2_ANODA
MKDLLLPRSLLFQVVVTLLRWLSSFVFFVWMILTIDANTARQTDVHSWHTFADKHTESGTHTHTNTHREAQNRSTGRLLAPYGTHSGDQTASEPPPLLLGRYDKRRSYAPGCLHGTPHGGGGGDRDTEAELPRR